MFSHYSLNEQNEFCLIIFIHTLQAININAYLHISPSFLILTLKCAGILNVFMAIFNAINVLFIALKIFS